MRLTVCLLTMTLLSAALAIAIFGCVTPMSVTFRPPSISVEAPARDAH